MELFCKLSQQCEPRSFPAALVLAMVVWKEETLGVVAAGIRKTPFTLGCILGHALQEPESPNKSLYSGADQTDF